MNKKIIFASLNNTFELEMPKTFYDVFEAAITIKQIKWRFIETPKGLHGNKYKMVILDEMHGNKYKMVILDEMQEDGNVINTDK